MAAKKRILVIGAGVCGLTAIKACKEENLDVVCYEKTGEVGGVWKYRETSVDGVPSIMKSTICNTSKEMSAFSDFPPPSHFPMFLTHSMMMKYLEMYADHFDLLTPINHYHEVIEMIPAEDYGSNGKWFVKVRNLNQDVVKEETFDGVMVCTGHHAYTNTPTYPGLDLFAGQILHSHAYKTFDGFENKCILVIGAGNSGTDIAVELSSVASKVYLSTRRGSWFHPRTFEKGKPLDVTTIRRSNVLQPTSVIEKKLQKLLNSTMDHGKFGIRPYHRVLSQHPTVNDELKNRLFCGSIIMKRDAKEFSESGVRFDGDEDVKKVDVVIFATGYQVKFPFINEDILRVGKNNKVFLYKNIFPPQLKHPSLGIMGLVQPHGALMPVYEMQARWFVSLLAGKSQLPACEVMLSEVRKVEDFRSRNYVQSQRHAFEEDWIGYMDDLAKQFGVKPNLPTILLSDSKLFWACFKGPCLPYQYRLSGPHRWDGARDAVMDYKNRLYGQMYTCEW